MESKHYLYVDNPFSKYACKGNHLRKSEECKVEHPQRVVSHYFQKVEEECKVRVLSRYFQNCSTKSIKDLDQFRYQSEKASSLRECVKNSELPPKISKDSRKRPKVETPRKSIEDLSQFMYQSEKVSSLIECVKKSELPPKISKDSRKRPKVEKPRKTERKTKPFLKADRCREAYKRKTPDNNWVPPRSTPPLVKKRLLQEYHFHDPWRVIVICMLLNRTKGKQVHSSKYFFIASLIFYADVLLSVLTLL